MLQILQAISLNRGNNRVLNWVLNWCDWHSSTNPDMLYWCAHSPKFSQFGGLFWSLDTGYLLSLGTSGVYSAVMKKKQKKEN